MNSYIKLSTAEGINCAYHKQGSLMDIKKELPSKEIISTTIAEMKDASIDKLIKKLAVELRHKLSFTKRIKSMKREGLIVCDQKGFLIDTTKTSRSGFVKKHPTKGFGFLLLDDGDDWFIPPKEMKKFTIGDKILAYPVSDDNGRVSAKYIRTISLPKNKIGQVVASGDELYVEPVNGEKIVISHEFKVTVGDWVVYDVTPTISKNSVRKAIIIEVINNKNIANLAFHYGLSENNIDIRRDKSVVEASELASNTEFNTGDRENLTDIPFCTIDGETAKDLDDAIYCEKNEDGFKLIVGIADVTTYMQKGDAVDIDAQSRMTSIYTPCNVAPMLDPSLSNKACSLNPNEPKLAMVCTITLDASGNVTDYAFKEAVIQSHKRFSYNRLQSMIDNGYFKNTPDNVIHSINAFTSLYELLKKKRTDRERFVFKSNEHIFDFDQAGTIKDIGVYPMYDTNKMIEEAMILANVCAAKFIKTHSLKTLFRTHDAPPSEGIAEINTFLEKQNIQQQLDDEFSISNVKSVIGAVEKAGVSESFDALIRKAMPPAEYTPHNSSHFGLNLEDYAHFTSPIRRYPDVVTHRVIKHILSETYGLKTTGGAYYSDPELVLLGADCNDKNKLAMLVERKANDFLAIKYIESKKSEVFEATLSSKTPHGVYVSILYGLIQGYIPMNIAEKKNVVQRCEDNTLRVKVDSIEKDTYKINFKVVG